MKILLTLFVLLLSSSVFADDISDFEIEGMSIRDSLLDYVSEMQIQNNIKDYTFKNDKFYAIDFDDIIPGKIYDGIGIFLKKNDERYLIYGIYGVIFYQYDINHCYEKKESIVEELKTLFNDIKIDDQGTYDSGQDPSGKSTMTAVWFDFGSSGDYAGVYCQDWSKEFEIKMNYTDHLRVTMRSNEFSNWMHNEAY